MDTHRLEEFILSKMSETRIPGLSIAIVDRDRVVYARGFGFRDLERGLPSTPETIYGIGSVTKSFTALAIMKLVEEGKLSLDDPVERYVPLKLRSMGEPIRIHHPLTHTSGIAALAYAEAFIRGSLQLDGETWLPLASPQDVISYMSGYEEWVVDKPGKRFFYLNEGYVLLGYIISKVTGIEYEDYVKQYILRPLSM
ncbi:MAG TPA: class A beta-lactamase-related serine hydrolase, partial [Ignisphaera aggregans]|nr:class A beta-lactamase-related serine hydrolase [Ignisphaera aggregans]